MTDLQQILRAARQNVCIDQMLGVSAVPLGADNELAHLLEEAGGTADGEAAAPKPALRAEGTAAAKVAATASTGKGSASRQGFSGIAGVANVSEPLPADTLDPQQKAAALERLAAEHAAECPHCSCRAHECNMVFGEGDADAAIMFVGEGPGAEEDRQGRPFVGRAGQLLDKQIAAMGLEREQVYIANIVKTRPPGNRVPTPEEATLCMPYLQRQIEIIHPTVIVSLGATSAKYLLNSPKLAITRERGTWRSFRGIDLMPTFHPAYLLRAYTVENRGRVWDDLKAVLEKAGLPLPAGKK